MSAILLTGCVNPDTPAEELATLPAGEVPADWETVTVDDWAQFNAPQGWTSGSHPDYTADSTQRYLIDTNGKRRIAVGIESSEFDYSSVECSMAPGWSNLLDTTPLPGAHAGENLAHSTRIEETSPYKDDAEEEKAAYVLYSTIHQLDLLEDGCVPEVLVFPEGLPGTLYWVVADETEEAQHFSTKEEAEAYTQTDEYWTVKKVIQSFRFVG